MSRSPLRLTVLFLGRTREPYLARGIEDFAKRLGHYAHLTLTIIKESSPGRKVDAGRAMDEGGRRLLSHAPAGALLVALDPKGMQPSSQDLAALLTSWEGQGRGHICFLIGGSLGLPAAVLDRCGLILSLSRLTFTHEMARLLLLEQLYRAFTIKQGTGYHK